VSLPRTLQDALGLEPGEADSVLRDMALLARVKTAEARGMVIIEISKEVFELMTQQAAEQQGVTFTVTWTTDEMGFSAPMVMRHERVDQP